MKHTEAGVEKVEDFIKAGVQEWVKEGKLSADEAESVINSLHLPEVRQGLLHAGAHFAISLPLRFPFGAMARFIYTLALRMRAEAAGLLRRESPALSRRLHTLPVMLISLLPGFGRLAYFFSPVLMQQRLLVLIPTDQISRKLPFRAYERLHFDALFVFWAEESAQPRGLRRFSPRRLFSSLRNRLNHLRTAVPFIGCVVLLDAVIFTVSTYVYFDSPRIGEWWERSDDIWFRERGVIASLDTIQLLIAGMAGIAAYRLFWRNAAHGDKAEAFGIALWGIGGIGLVFFAVEDFFTVHETLGEWFTSMLPGGLNDQGDFLILGYAAVSLIVIYVFHTELTAERASASLLILASMAALVMVATDAFAKSLALHALELPVQTLATSFLMVAFVARYQEVRSLIRESPDHREARVDSAVLDS